MKQENYAFEKNILILIDPELDLHVKEPFKPILVPLSKKEMLPDGYRLRTTGRKDGPYREFLIEKKGIPDGQCLLLFSNGRIKMESYYSNGKLHGPSSFFAEEGQLLSKAWFLHGVQQGKSWSYYLDGSLYAIQRFREGLWQGKQEFFYPDGKLKTLMHYEKGQLQGSVEVYGQQGLLERQLEYNKGLRITPKETSQ